MNRDGPEANVIVREATPDDRIEVRRVLDAAMLAVRDDLPERIEAGDVLVAEADGAFDAGEDRPTLGALVVVPFDCEEDGAHVDAVAVRRARRAQGVGSALVRTAAERRARLTAEFDRDVRSFYESLEFEISEQNDGRLRGVLE
jgi:GNAT superfamily N-acetyltransferase